MFKKFLQISSPSDSKSKVFSRIRAYTTTHGVMLSNNHGAALEKSASSLTQGGKGRSFEAWGTMVFKNDGE